MKGIEGSNLLLSKTKDITHFLYIREKQKHMKFTKSSILVVAFIFSEIIFAQQSIREKILEIAVIEEKVMMPMRDGIRLATDIYRPKTDQKVPIIFSRTPYNINRWGDGEERTRTMERAYEALKRGYAYVVQNERGRFFLA